MLTYKIYPTTPNGVETLGGKYIIIKGVKPQLAGPELIANETVGVSPTKR